MLRGRGTDARVIVAEALGTALLAAVVIGSGIMAKRLSAGNAALALLANSIATGAALYVLITVLGPVSGAHFNPLVTAFLERDRPRTPIVLAQIAGGGFGAILANVMFGAPAVFSAIGPRTGQGQWLGEVIATFGLILVIRLGIRHAKSVPALVACWIMAAYWFTASTSFANPAMTIARALTGSFAGIRWIDVPAFLAAQTVGALLGQLAANHLIGGIENESDHLA